MDLHIGTALLILGLPLLAFVVQIFFSSRLPRQGDWLPTAAMGICALFSVAMLLIDVLPNPQGIEPRVWSMEWLSIGYPASDVGGVAVSESLHARLGNGGLPMSIRFGIQLDNLSVIMLVVVTLVSFLVHVYSIGYMRNPDGTPQDRYGRFFAYLALFSFSMIGLVLADSLLFLFIFWELVGVCSYFLIGFYFQKQSACHAAIKAFLTTKVGDCGFLLTLMIIAAVVAPLPLADLGLEDTAANQEVFHAFSFARLFKSIEVGVWSGLELAGLALLPLAGVLLFLGPVGKSGQFPLHVWLPDAMEGPTPVSALIHAATMVAAGVYLVARCFPFFAGEGYFSSEFLFLQQNTALTVVAWTGAFTTFFAATIALVQTDIKKVLAYSTVSQLGYMILGIGVGSFSAGMFHLWTHAFFKALLFLGAGSVIHAVGTNEMTKMGGLRRKMPITFVTFLIATMAISGVPFLSGFYSKEGILTQAMALGLYRGGGIHLLPFVFGIVSAALTAFYMFRIIFMVFTGEPRDQHRYRHAHESPATMTIPLVTLAVLAVFSAGFFGLAGQHWFGHRVNNQVIVRDFLKKAEAGQVTVAHATAAAGHGAGADPDGGDHDVAGDNGGGHAVTPGLHGLYAGGDHAPAFVAFLDSEHQAHLPTLLMSLVVATFGIFGCFAFFAGAGRGERSAGEASGLSPSLRNFLCNLWYVDWLYYKVVVGGLLWVRHYFFWFDQNVIDRMVNRVADVTGRLASVSGKADDEGVDGAVRGVANLILWGGGRTRLLQTGNLQEYLVGSVLMLGTILIVVVWLI